MGELNSIIPVTTPVSQVLPTHFKAVPSIGTGC